MLRGHFDPLLDKPQWCDRSLLARIHRYTLNRLRAEIEPVDAADFMRFLFAWQHLDTNGRLSGIDGLRAVVALCNVPYHLVSPVKWKRHFALDSDKERSRALAIRLWPGVGLFSRVKDHNRAEAALIARYGVEVIEHRSFAA